MSHRRKQKLKAVRREQERIIEHKVREQSTRRQVTRRFGQATALMIRQTNQFALLVIGSFSVAQGLIPWTTSLADRAVPVLYGLGFLVGLVFYRRLIR